MRKLSIYIHIPFCIRKCYYCDFLSFPAGERERERYLGALLREIEGEAPKYKDYMVDTVFLGGGTPTVLSGKQIGRVLAELKAGFSFVGGSDDCGRSSHCSNGSKWGNGSKLGGMAEITMEANPGTVDREKLEQCRQAGVNRLSIGAQSLRNEELALLGRIHRAEDFYQAYRWAREAGFRNINVDLMAALPGQKPEEYRETLRKAADLGPEHISAYSLIVEEGTLFYDWYGEGVEKKWGEEDFPKKADGHAGSGTKGSMGAGEGRPALPSEEEERLMDEWTGEILGEYGYRRYEISNYARPGYECRHNMAYWKRYDYAGFGLGAASMVGNVRWKNSADMGKYIGCMEAEALPGRPGDALSTREALLEGEALPERGGFPEEGRETVKEEVCQLSVPEQMEEFMFLGLRLTEGVGKKEFYEAFGEDMASVYGKVIEKLESQGLVTDGERVRLTPYGRDVSNYVMAEFLF